MIVRPDGNGGLLLITQPDHAALASRIIAAWPASAFTPTSAREAVLYAVAEHDNGWLEVEQAPVLDRGTGRPYDFMTVPLDFKQAIWPRGVARLAAIDPLAAALVAEHGLRVHAHRRDEPDWRAFFARVERLRDELLARCGALSGSAHDAFTRNYRLLFLGDLLSLVFCNQWTEPSESHGYRAVFRDGGVLVSPDPFGGREIALEIGARRIPDRRYASQADLVAAWEAAETVTIVGRARGKMTSEVI
ncbi:MAG: DUF3891 family protein [Bacteroidales bacterium]